MAQSKRHDRKLDEVSEKQASGEVAEIYGRIKEALQVNMVNFVWRVFATKPRFLAAVWNELEPSVDQGFLAAGDGIRALAIERVREASPVPDHRGLLGDDIHQALQELRVFLEANPRLLILLCALRRSWQEGEVGGMRPETPAERKIPDWHPEVDTASSPHGELKATLEDMTEVLDLPSPNTDYLALAKWPEYLNAAWQDLRVFVGNEAWRDAATTVDWVAEQTALALPSKIRVSPNRAAEFGLATNEVDEVGTWIDTFHGLLPGLILNTSYFWIGMEGGVRPLNLAQRAEEPIEKAAG
jgi:hypothetical protein